MSDYIPVKSDRLSTREELIQVLELIGELESAPVGDATEPEGDLLTCLEAEDSASTTSDLLDEFASKEEQLLRDIEPFHVPGTRKAEQIN